MKNIYDIQGNVLMQVPVTPECEHAEELMRTDEVRMFWNAADCVVIPAGAYVEVPESVEKYYLVEPYKPIQRKENMWRYEPVFVSAFYALSKVPFYMYTYEGGDPTGQITSCETDWVLTDTPYNFISTLCRAIKNETGVKYLPAAALDLPASATVTFASTDVVLALNAIANAFGTEWWLEKFANPDSNGNVGRIHLGFANDGATPKVLTVGTNINVPSVSDGREGFYNRFVILGSTRNITQEYRGANVNSIANKRLTLDPTTYPGGYIDYSDGAAYTKILVFDGVYPAANLRIKSGSVLARLRYVLDENGDRIEIQPGVYSQYAIYYFKLEKYENGQWSDFVFNNTDYDPVDNPSGMRLPNQKVSIHFSSGPLMGREFELEYHEDALVNVQDKADELPFSAPAGSFEIVKTQEGDYIIPALTGLVPGANDEVILFNIMMPETYVVSAQDRLEAEAFKEIGKNYLQLNADGTAKRDAAGNLLRVDKNSYQFTSNPVAFNASNPGLKIASAVTYVNGAYSLATRVKSLVTKLDYPIKQTITVGEELTKGTIEELKDNAANANDDINLLDALSASTQRLLDAYNRTQEFIQAGLADDYFELNETLTSLVQLKAAYQYLGAKNGVFFAGASMTGTPEPDLYVKVVGEGANQQRVLYSPLALITAGDQIVGNGTPGGGGGGGGGAGYLYELGDVYGSTDVLRPDGSPKQGGDILGYNSTIGKWVAVDGSTIGGVTSVVGQTGTVTVSQIASALTGAGYKLTDTVITDYWKTGDTRTKNTVLAAPNGSNGAATFRALVPADIPSLAISKITNLQTSLNAKQDTISDLDTIRSNASNGNTAYNSLGNYVLKAGDTMTGDLIISKTGGGNLIIRGTEANHDGGTLYFYGRYYSGNPRNGAKIAAVYPGSGTYDIQDLVFSVSRNRTDATPTWEEAMRIASTKAVSITDSLSVGTTLSVTGLATLSGGATIPVNKKMTIGDAEIEWIPNSGNGYLKINKPLLTVGDQIVNSGTPGGGGGGGGAGYLYELGDVYSTSSAVLRSDGTTPAQPGDVLSYYDSTKKWVASNDIVHLAGAQTITGTKTFSSGIKVTGRYQSSGDDEGVVIGFASNNYAAVCLGDPSGARSVFYFSSTGGAPFWRYNNGTTSYNISHPGKAGTIALTSDIPNVPSWALASTKPSYTFAEITAKITHTNEFNFIPDAYDSYVYFNYRSSADTAVNISKYIFHNGSETIDGRASVEASSFIKYGGTSAQFLKADGSVDSSTYLTTGAAASTYLPLSAGSGKPLTGDLYLTAGKGIEAPGGAGLLVYHPSDWTGISNTQWGVGASDSQGVIRSNNNNLLHYRNGSNYTIWDGSNSNGAFPWACSTLSATTTATIAGIEIGNTNEINGVSAGAYTLNIHLNYRSTGDVSLAYGGGNVGVGVLNPGYKFHLVGSARFQDSAWNSFGIKRTTSGGAWICFYPNNQETEYWDCGAGGETTPLFKWEYSGATTVASLSSTGVFTTNGDQVISSDINLKTNLAPVTYGVEDIAKTRAVTFDWKDGRGKSAGSIAQDWKPLIPELVHGEEGNMTLAYGQIAMLNTILLARRSEDHETRIKALELENAELRKEIERLRS